MIQFHSLRGIWRFLRIVVGLPELGTIAAA